MTQQYIRNAVGDLRPSQLLHTFGIGSIVDLPHLSVMIMGLDDWDANRAHQIGEERLLAAIRQELGAQVAQLLAPPTPPETTLPGEPPPLVGVPVASFPRWVLCPACRLLAPMDANGLFKLKQAQWGRTDQVRYEHINCRATKPPTVLPARFLVACEQGHIDDFPWLYFVHRGPSACQGPLRLQEIGVSGEAADIQVSCDACGPDTKRRLVEAFGESALESLPACRGRRPHLRDFASEPCQETLKTISLGASNSWFGVTMSALSIPTGSKKITQLVEHYWHALSEAESEREAKLLRKPLRELAEFSDSELWEAIQEHRNQTGGPAAEPQNLKTPEWIVFTNPGAAPRSKHFQVRAVAPPLPYAGLLSRVVLVERLREVRALVGFTRIMSPGDLDESSGGVDERYYAPLSRTPARWVPASEVHGEGIFLQFDEQAIQAWMDRAALKARATGFFQAHRSWRAQRRLDPDKAYPGLRYVMLHTFAHGLMRQLALECGYAMASIRERIYALDRNAPDGPMAGILLYTAAPDSEGTLGGLVKLGEPEELGPHLERALESMHLCASDPLCAEHAPDQDPPTLHGAACHACLFAPETSCERGNKYLDRSLVVPTIEQPHLAFFGPRP
jgi:hypothetical protein